MPRVAIPMARGQLGKHGYAKVKTLSLTRRRDALRSAAAELGWPTVQRKLNVLFIYNKNRYPAMAALFKEDAVWARQQRLVQA